MKSSTLTVSFVFLLFQILTLDVFASSLIGPKNYNGSPQTKFYTEAPVLTVQDTVLVYKLKVKNADGADHIIQTCNQINILTRVMCQLTNMIQAFYLNTFRVSSAQVTVNGVVVMSAAQMNRNIKYFEVPISLKTTNNILIQVTGPVASFINLEIEKPNVSVDTTPPVLSFNLGSNSLTRSQNLSVVVTDASNTTTSVWDNQNNLILTTTSKQFDVPLVEGVNNFVFKSVDAYQNATSFINLTNIIKDTTPAVILTNLVPTYIYSSYPQVFTLILSVNEDVQNLSVNGGNALLIGPRTYQYLLNVQEPGIMTLNLSAMDLAGNVSNQTYSPVFSIDNIPPVVSASLASNTITNQTSVHISVVDNADSVTTAIYINDAFLRNDTNKEFDIALNEGVYNIKLIAQDQYNNVANPYLVSNLTIDLTPPMIASDIKSNYYFQSLPNVVHLHFVTNEATSVVTVNNQIATRMDSQHYQFDLSVTKMGQISFDVKTTDLAGNTSLQTLTTQITVDNTAPVITLTLPTGPVTADTYVLPVQISDMAPTLTQVILNSQVLDTVSETNFSYLVTLPSDGVYNVQIISTDAAGNTSSKSGVITKDTSLLSLQIQSPQSGAIYNSQIIDVRFSTNKTLKHAYVNNVEVSLNADLKSVTYSTQVLMEGFFNVVIQVEDLNGNIVSNTVNAELRSNGLSSWGYEECPIAEAAQ